MTDLRTAAQQALECLKGVARGKYDGNAAGVCAALEAALAQQAEPVEPVAAERERCAEYLMQQAAECRENSPTRVTLESCAAVLRLGLVEWVAQPAEPVGTRALIEECLAAFAQELAAWDIDPPLHHVKQAHDKCEAWLAAPPQQAEPDAYGYASRLAVAIWEKHYRDIAPQWKPLDDLMGVLTQIDNMAAGMTRLAQQAEPVDTDCHTQGICQRSGYGITQQAEPVEPVEPVAWRWGYRSVTTGEMDWRGYVEIPAHPNLRSPEIIMQPLYFAPPQRKPLTKEEIRLLARDTFLEAENIWNEDTREDLTEFIRAVERAHGIPKP